MGAHNGGGSVLCTYICIGFLVYRWPDKCPNTMYNSADIPPDMRPGCLFSFIKPIELTIYVCVRVRVVCVCVCVILFPHIVQTNIKFLWTKNTFRYKTSRKFERQTVEACYRDAALCIKLKDLSSLSFFLHLCVVFSTR